MDIEVREIIRRKLLPGAAVLALCSLVMLAACQGDDTTQRADDVEANQTESAVSESEPLPMLVDLGRGTCKACKRMKPILDELTAEYEGKAIVKFIDLRHQPEAAREYGIRLIPTQIFFDVEGNEVFRHEGFMSKESIMAKFNEMGVH